MSLMLFCCWIFLVDEDDEGKSEIVVREKDSVKEVDE